jgi:plasmid replication initiation protein
MMISQNLVKPSGMIQMINVLTAVERKAYNYLLYKARKSTDDGPWEVPMAELELYLGMDRRNRAFLMDVLAEMLKHTITYNVFNKDKTDIWHTHSALFSQVGFNLDSTAVRYALPPDLLLILRNPSMYAKIDMHQQFQLKSSTAVALYEYYVDQLGGKRLNCSVKVKVEDLRTLLGWQNKYEKQKEMNRQLEAANDQIRLLGELNIDMAPIKMGRKTQFFDIHISRKATAETAMSVIRNILS